MRRPSAHAPAPLISAVPLAALTLTQEEWDALGKHGVGAIPKAKQAIDRPWKQYVATLRNGNLS